MDVNILGVDAPVALVVNGDSGIAELRRNDNAVVLAACRLPPLHLPEWALDTTTVPARLSPDKAREYIKGQEGIVRARAEGALLEQLRKLESVPVEWDGRFFGAALHARGEFKLFLSTLVVDDSPPADGRIAEFTLRADATLFANANIKVTHAVSVVFRRAAKPLIRFSLEDLNFAFPNLEFDSLDLPSFGAPLQLREASAALVSRLAGVAADVDLACTDPANEQPPQLAVAASGAELSWALVKKDVTSPAFGDPAQLAAQLATFKASVKGGAAVIDGIRVAASGGRAIVEGRLSAAATIVTGATRSGTLGPFAWRVEGLSVVLQGTASATEQAITAVVTFDRLVVRLVDDPQTVIALQGAVELTPSAARVVELNLVEPYPIELVRKGAQALLRGARAVATLFASPDPVDLGKLKALLDILGKFAAAVVRQAYVVGSAVASAAARAAGVIGEALDALAEGLAALLRQLGELADAPDGFDIQITIGLDPIDILQVLVVRKTALLDAKPHRAAGIEVTFEKEWRLGVLIDLAAERGAYLVAVATPASSAGAPLVKFGTDLWLEGAQPGTVQRTHDADRETGERPKDRLIELTLSHNKPGAMVIVLAGLREGKGVFLQSLQRRENVTPAPGVLLAEADSRLVSLDTDIGVGVKFEKDRLLPLLGMGETGEKAPSPGEPGFLDKLKEGIGQVVWVEKFHTPTLVKRTVEGKLDLGVKAAGVTTQVSLDLRLSLDTLHAAISGPQALALKSRRIEEKALGLTWVVDQADEKSRKNDEPVEMFRLDFTGGESSFALDTSKARMELRFGGLSGDGDGVVFKVKTFRVGRNGVDISAAVDKRAVRLNGLNERFEFQSGTFEMRGGRLLEASASGRGPLPSGVVGEAYCTLRLTFAQTDNGIDLQSGNVEVEKKGDPIVCHTTRFTLTLDDLDVGIQKDGGGYHFYFLVTGSMRFTPKGGEFETGLLAYLKDIEINLERAPLTGDARVLGRHISFQKALSPKKTFNVFNLFTFELRGFGFHPSSPRFDGKPAINLSGQIKFAEIGDVMQPKIDFHGLWIAPAKDGEALPRISAEGLGVDLQLSGAVKIRGAVLAVDRDTRTVEGREFAPPGYDCSGFLGEGEVDIPGWGTLPAALGFLELEKKDGGERKKAFFICLQREKLAIKIPTGFWTFYMREVGFGFGFRYTLAAIRAADDKPSLAQRIAALDDASRRQGDLARFAAWSPDPEGDRFTLALRGAVQAYPAKEVYNEKEEETAENPFFFDLVVALRSDFTLLASLRGYLGVNYADFRANKDDFRERPGLRGYLYVSAPRSELLARMIGDSRGHIGERLPNLKKGQVLRQALESVDWSATLYIRPGLFHYELGWPNQLSVRLVDTSTMKVSIRGGMIFRAADDGILWGYNIEADAWLRLGGSTGGDIGVAVEATLQARFVARLIAYLSWRFQGSLVYGLISLDATIEFSVRAWMRVNLRFTSFTIRISFSFSLHFSAAIEMVVCTEGVGGRVRARVAVSAFGCTLGVFVGFSFNDDALDAARARVQRFMAMSLTSEALPEPPQLATGDADRRIEQDAKRVDDARPQPGSGQANQPERDAEGHESLDLSKAGIDLRPTRFWLALHEDPARPGHAYALLVPRERTGDEEGGFYCAPKGRVEAAHVLRVEGDLARFDKVVLCDTHGEEALVTQNVRKANWKAEIPVDAPPGSAAPPPVTLGSVFDECFLTSYKWDETSGSVLPWDWKEPFGKRESPARADNPQGSAGERALKRERLQKDQAAHAARAPADERAYQARSTVLAMFIDQFVTLARNGSRSGTQAHVLDLGLVLRGPVDALEALAGALHVAKGDCPGEGSVEVLNPSRGWFTNEDPELRDARREMAETGPRLGWEFDAPRGHVPSGVDPESFLLHYEVRRTVEGREFDDASSGRDVRRVKPAATMGATRDGKIQLLRADWQYSDDLADLPPEWRRALLPPRNETETLEAATAWMQLGLGEDVTITWSVSPVDIAGTKGQPRSFTLDVQRPRPAIRAAVAEMRIFADVSQEAWQGRDSRPLSIEAYLGLRDAAWKADGQFPSQGQDYDVTRRYRLYVEHEAVLPAGSFGADGLTDGVRGVSSPAAVAAAIERAVAEDEAALRADPKAPRRTFLVSFASLADLAAAGKDAAKEAVAARVHEFEQDAQTLARLRHWAYLSGPKLGAATPACGEALADQLWQTGGSRAACRFWLRTEVVVAKHGVAGAVPLVLESAPTAVDISFVLRAAGGKAPFPAMQPQAFEWPVHLELPPLRHGQVRVETGFMHVLAPRRAATLAQWHSEKTSVCATLLRDPARRTLAKLEFDAVPQWTDVDALHLSSIAGYDVHELDLDDLAPLDSSKPLQNDPKAWRRARRIAQVKLVPPDVAQLTPAHNADWLGWQAAYPSETWRTMREPGDFLKREALPVRRGWYSLAESYPAFAKRRPRVRLLPHAVDVQADALMAGGRPERIVARLQYAADSGFAKALSIANGSALVTATHLSLAGPGVPAWDLSTPNEFLPLGVGEFSASQLRYLLLCLCLQFDRLETAYAVAQPDALAGLTLVLTADRPSKPEVPAVEVTVPLTFDSPMHGLLEETVAELAWGSLAEGGVPQPYRKFAVMVQAPPVIDAEELARFLAATPQGVDPYGWCVLQGLGLAATLRLFDLEKGEFVGPTELAREVNRVFGHVTARWRSDAREEADVGQPFADVLLRAGANRVVRPFDKVAEDGELPDEMSANDQGLAMMQISLRPVPQCEWHYVLADLPPVPPLPDPDPLQPKPVLTVTDVRLAIDRTTSGTEIDFMFARTQARATLGNGVSSGGIVVPAEAGERPLLVIRRRHTEGAMDGLALSYVRTVRRTETLPGGESKTTLEVLPPDPATPTGVTLVKFAGLENLYDPFGHFPEKTAEDWSVTRPLDSVRQHLRFVAPRLALEGEPGDQALMPQYLEWARRFLDHAAGPDAIAAGEVAIAFAAPSKASPCELPADSTGVLTLTIPSDDRLAHARAYAVRPVSRYAHVIASTREGADHGHVEQLVTNEGHEFGYAVAVHPRTERIEPPVILGNSVHGASWEVVLGRHGEESLSHSNRPLFARLGKPSLLVTQVRSYRVPRWLERLHKKYPALQAPDVYPRRDAEPATPPPAGGPPGLPAERIEALAGQHWSLWKGAEVFTFPALAPHYRGAALAVARAGIVVSNISAAVQDDFGRAPLSPAAYVADALQPALSLVRAGTGRTQFRLRWRLLSHLELTPVGTRDTARPADADVAWWPDPDVIYGVVHAVERVTPKLREELLELRMLAGGEPSSEPLVLRTRGDRWKEGPAADNRIESGRDSGGRPTFMATLWCAPREDGPGGGESRIRVAAGDMQPQDEFKRFVAVSRKFATVVTTNVRRFALERVGGETNNQYIQRIGKLMDRVASQRQAIDLAAADVDVTTLRSEYDRVQALLGADATESVKRIDEALAKGVVADLIQARPQRWPEGRPPLEAGFLELVVDPAADAELVLRDLPSDREVNAMLRLVSLPLTAVDSPFWQWVVRRITGGADHLLLRMVDGRSAAASVHEIRVDWPRVVPDTVTRGEPA